MKAVREAYAKIAKQSSFCCSSSSCWGSGNTSKDINKRVRYRENELKTVSAESNLGFRCENPVAFASLKKGEVIFELSSGVGLDCFLVAKKSAEKVDRNELVIGEI